MYSCIFCAGPGFNDIEIPFKHLYNNHSVSGDKGKWSIDQSVTLAKIEILLRELCPLSRNINILLAKCFKGKTRDEIKRHRTTTSYKDQLELIANTSISSSLNNILNPEFSILPEDLEQPDCLSLSPKLSSCNISSVNSPLSVRGHTGESTPHSLISVKPFGLVGDSDVSMLGSDPKAVAVEEGSFGSLVDPKTKFDCLYCGRIFTSKIGLSQHKRHTHYEEYILEVQLACGSSRNTIWTDEEIALLAYAEIKAETDPDIKFLNIYLQKQFPHRTSNQISCMRKRARYKSILENIRVEGQVVDSPSCDNEVMVVSNSGPSPSNPQRAPISITPSGCFSRINLLFSPSSIRNPPVSTFVTTVASPSISHVVHTSVNDSSADVGPKYDNIIPNDNEFFKSKDLSCSSSLNEGPLHPTYNPGANDDIDIFDLRSYKEQTSMTSSHSVDESGLDRHSTVTPSDAHLDFNCSPNLFPDPSQNMDTSVLALDTQGAPNPDYTNHSNNPERVKCEKRILDFLEKLGGDDGFSGFRREFLNFSYYHGNRAFIDFLSDFIINHFKLSEVTRD